MSRALFLFAPKFREFGVDIASSLIKAGAVDKIDGICTGGARTAKAVQEGLSSKAGELIDIEAEELAFTDRPVSRQELAALDHSLPAGAVGRIITADRRLGAGFVFGGSTRPSRLKAMTARRSVLLPAIYCVHLVSLLADLIDRTRPRFIFLYAHAASISAALCELAVQRGIPIYRFTPARIGSRILVDADPLGLFSALARHQPDQIGSHSTVARLEAATHHLHDFRTAPRAPDYSKFTTARNSWKRLPRILARAALVTGRAAVVLPGRRNPDQWTTVQRAWHDASNALKRLFASNRYFSRDIPENRRIVYFPLHVDPEASTMVLAPYHTNQIAVVEALAKALPADAILVVKEHRPMKGLRPRGFYKTIASMPRVVLLSPDIDGLDCVKRADLTAVITGTAAWEAVRLGKPALVVGNSPYLQMGEGIVHEPCLAKLPEAMKKAFEIPPARDETLIAFLAALHAASFDLKTSLLWGKYLDHSEQERSEATRAVVDKLLALIDMHDKAKASSSDE